MCTLLTFCETKQSREEREADAKWGARKGALNLPPKKGSQREADEAAAKADSVKQVSKE